MLKAEVAQGAPDWSSVEGVSTVAGGLTEGLQRGKESGKKRHLSQRAAKSTTSLSCKLNDGTREKTAWASYGEGLKSIVEMV